MIIRPFQLSDRTQVLHIFQLNTPAWFAPEEAADLEDYLSNNAQHYFVVENEGVIIGSGGFNLFPEEQTARISWDIIHPDFHGKGVGKTLTQFRIDAIQQLEPDYSIIVRTSQLAYGFYEKLGFVLEQVEKDYWAKGFDLYLMRLPQKVQTLHRP